MNSPYKPSKKKVNFSNYLNIGAISLEEAAGTRVCVCGNKILKGEQQLAIYQSRGAFNPSRYNFCRQCSYKLLMAATQQLYSLERKMFGEGGA